MFPVKEFEKRFRELLAQLDELRDAADDRASGEMDEMNADFEDALFVIECIDADDDDWREEFSDALAEFRDLCADYRRLDVPGLAEAVDRLEMAVRLAENNLNQ